MTWVRLVAVLMFSGCSSEPSSPPPQQQPPSPQQPSPQQRQEPPAPTPVVPAPSPSKPAGVKPASSPPKVLTGPAPRSEIDSVEEPTPATIARDLCGWYPQPQLVTVARKDDRGVTVWTRSYDGIDMDIQAVTSRLGTHYITRFHPELAAPERVQRDKLIGEDAAKKASTLPDATTAKLFYIANLAQRQLAGTAGTNAADFIMLVESWRLAYRIEGSRGGVYVDAYTGDVVRRWNNWVN